MMRYPFSRPAHEPLLHAAGRTSAGLKPYSPIVLTIVHAELADAEAIAGLLDESDKYYGGNGSVSVAELARRLRNGLFAEPRTAWALLAKDGDRVAGFAVYSFLWPAGDYHRLLYLKELFVSGVDRRHGVGRLLMERLMTIAAEAGCSRMQWTADIDNPAALGFYHKMGFPEHKGKTFYRVPIQPAGSRNTPDLRPPS